MIIVEGPDGSGKSTLVRKLAHTLNLPVDKRVVDHNTNALVDITQWTEANLAEGFQRRIFDRHRLISEPIYGVAMGRQSRSSFWMDDRRLMMWFNQLRQIEPITIYCLPPLNTVVENCRGPENQAVWPYIAQIYRGYQAHIARNPGFALPWDYTSKTMGDFSSLVHAVEVLLKARS